MKENEISQFKYNFLNLRWLIVIAAGYMAVFSAEHSVFTEVNYINALVLFFILSNIFLYFLSPEFFKSRNFRYFVFLGDIVFVTLAIYLTKSGSTDFFLLYFLVIVITALGKDLKASIIATVVASLLYFWIIMKKDADVNLYDANIYMRIPFLFVVGLFTGFLSETVKKEESHVKDLRLILAITDVVNENMDYNVMVKLLEPFFKKMEVVSDWEIGVFNENTATFKLLRAGTEVVARDLEPEIVERLINKSEVYRGERYIYFPQTREKKASGFLRIEPVSFEKFFSQDQDLFMTLAGEFAIALERDRLYEQIKNLANSDRLTEL